jgi:hypothetical protein
MGSILEIGGPARRLAVGALLVATIFAGGCDDDDYDPPTSPRASLVARGSLDFSCGLNCSYEGEAVNEGLGCAFNVRGLTRLRSATGAVIESDSWVLPPLRRIQPGEPFHYDGCCFSVASQNAMSSYETEFEWDRISCEG